MPLITNDIALQLLPYCLLNRYQLSFKRNVTFVWRHGKDILLL